MSEIPKNLKKGDVLKWTWNENGCAVNGGEGIVLNDLVNLVERTAYDITVINISTLASSVDTLKVVANIFENRDFKLNVDKKTVIKDGKPVIINGVVLME